MKFAEYKQRRIYDNLFSITKKKRNPRLNKLHAFKLFRSLSRNHLFVYTTRKTFIFKPRIVISYYLYIK